MKTGDWMKWVETKKGWPPYLVAVLKDYEAKYGEGPFQIINIIQGPDPVDIVFMDKNGKETKLCSLWFEVILLKENPNPSVH